MTEGARRRSTPLRSLRSLVSNIVLYPATGFKAAAKALQDVYCEIAESGTQKGVMDRLVTWQGRNEITGLEEIVEIEQRYATED